MHLSIQDGTLWGYTSTALIISLGICTFVYCFIIALLRFAIQIVAIPIIFSTGFVFLTVGYIKNIVRRHVNQNHPSHE